MGAQPRAKAREDIRDNLPPEGGRSVGATTARRTRERVTEPSGARKTTKPS